MDEDEISITPDKEEEEVVNNNDSDDNEEYSLEEDTWIEWFCKLEGNHFFVEISDEFFRKKTNLYDLEREFPNYQQYLDIILAKEAPSSDMLTEEYMDQLKKIKEFYGICHRRFLYTSLGTSMAREKFMNGVYGACPRILCHKQSVLPYGISEEMKYTRVMIFCPSCQEVYKPRGNLTDMDGAYFGPNFPQHFLLYYKDFNYFKKGSSFNPKLYGFNIFGKPGSKYYGNNDKINQVLKKHNKDNNS